MSSYWNKKSIKKLSITDMFLVSFVLTSLISVISFRIIEDKTWLEAIYFTIITLATVGFGDIAPTNPLTQVITILLVINGIVFIGLASQFLINRVVDLQISRASLFPSSTLPYENHVIIGGYGSKGRRLAQLFKERMYTVVVVEQDTSLARLAEANEFIVVNGDITKPTVLDILRLDKAAGLFLLLSDDTLVIQTGIIARSIAPNLDIYGEFLGRSTYNISRYAGINKPISLFIFLTNEIQSYFSRHLIQPIFMARKEMIQQQAELSFLRVPQVEAQKLKDQALLVGSIAMQLNEIYVDAEDGLPRPKLSRDNYFLLGFQEGALKSAEEFELQAHKKPVNRLIFAGYSDLVESLIERLEFPTEDIVVLWKEQKDQEVLETKSIANYEWVMETGHILLQELIQEGDVVICSLDITSSLILAVTLNNIMPDTKLLQLVPYEFDIEPLIKVGADVVYTPQQIISNAMLNIFMRENNLPPSAVFVNGHIYEHLVTQQDFYHNKSIQQLEKDMIFVLFIKDSSSGHFYQPINGKRLEIGDRILVYIRNLRKERLDMDFLE